MNSAYLLDLGAALPQNQSMNFFQAPQQKQQPQGGFNLNSLVQQAMAPAQEKMQDPTSALNPMNDDMLMRIMMQSRGGTGGNNPVGGFQNLLR